MSDIVEQFFCQYKLKVANTIAYNTLLLSASVCYTSKIRFIATVIKL